MRVATIILKCEGDSCNSHHCLRSGMPMLCIGSIAWYKLADGLAASHMLQDTAGSGFWVDRKVNSLLLAAVCKK